MTDEEKEEIMKAMTPEQADRAMHIAEEEFSGETDEDTEKAAN